MYFEQLIAGALLKFKGEVDKIDISLLNGFITEKMYNKDFKIINKYFKYENDKFSFKEGYDFDTLLENNSTIKDALDKLQGDFKEFFTNLDLNEFVLIKIKYLDYIRKEELKDKLTKEEYNIALDLLQKGYLSIPWIKDGTIYGDFEALTLTKEGEVYIFMKGYHTQVDAFKNELISNGYNPDLLFMYLATKNLDSDFRNIFDIGSFRLFGHIYDLDISLKTLKR